METSVTVSEAEERYDDVFVDDADAQTDGSMSEDSIGQSDEIENGETESRCSDKKILRHCGLLDLLEQGDVIMADRGFDMDSDIKERGISIVNPAFHRGRDQFESHENIKSRQLAQVRVHVERAVRKIKEFKILEGVIPITLVPMLDRIWTVCVHLANFTGDLIKSTPKISITVRRKAKQRTPLAASLARLQRQKKWPPGADV
ncbi:hypothetical protein B566_EDAN012648 [Ephemera danica]|nr:hypothetical protein B566_EDAN012648 [Ephemera danica]